MSSFTLLTQLIKSSFVLPSPSSVLPSILSVHDWQDIYEESRRQAVTALLYDAILMLPKEQRPPRSVLFHFMSMTRTIESDNRLREEALLAFHSEMMQPLGLPTVVVKGSSLAACYPQPLHRECGDNDLYTGTNTEVLCRYLESHGIEVDRKDPRHASFSFHGVDFEAHSYLLYHGDDPQWHPLRSPLSALRSEEEAFFLAMHIEHHAVFFHNPVRLRDLLDWSMLLKRDGFEISKLRELKRGSDVEHFAELMSLACNSLLGSNIDCQSPDGLVAADFETLFMQCPERHPLAIVRVARRSAKYIRYRRKYRALYGQSMFRRFYFKNVYVAICNKVYKKV